MKRINTNKGFTLIELLAVIVILAVIMVFAIPAVLDTSNNAQKKAIQMYAERVASKALEKAMSDQLLGTGTASRSEIYDLKTDLKLTDTGNYVGCAVMEKQTDNVGDTSDYTVTVYLTDGRFCTEDTGVVLANASSFTVKDSGCPAVTDSFDACS